MEIVDEKTADAIGKTNKLRDELLEAAEAAGLLHRAHDADVVGTTADVIEIDDDGFMHGTNVACIPSVRSSALAAGLKSVDGIEWHFTDTRGAGAVNLAMRIAAKGASRSCHAWVDAKGMIAQSISFKRGAWHSGSDTARRLTRLGDGRLTVAPRGAYSANAILGGIELENAGELHQITSRDGKSRVWASWPYRWDYVPAGAKSPELPIVVPESEVYVDGHAHGWHMYTPAQVVGAERVARALATQYGMHRDNVTFGHSQIDPSRRTDPGPLWQGAAWNDRDKPVGGQLSGIVSRIYGEAVYL